MPQNKIEDLRNHLFETLEGLKDKDDPMDLARAKAVAEVAKVIVESAKVEVSFLKTTGALQSTGFLPMSNDEAPPARRLKGAVALEANALSRGAPVDPTAPPGGWPKNGSRKPA
jgi:hypothetical protein